MLQEETRMYINNVKKTKFLTFGWIQIILGGIHAILGFVGISDMIVNFDDVFIMWAVLGAIFLFFGIRNFSMLKNCNAFSGAFRSDDDGFVTVQEIAFRLGISEEKALKKLQMMVAKGCLVNAVVSFKENKPVVVLQENRNRTLGEGDFQVVRCPNCGNTCSAKAGIVNKCQFCGGLLKL